MFVVAHTVYLALVRPHALVEQPARVTDDFAGFTWEIRARSPAFQKVVSGLVELSTEFLGLVAVWSLFAHPLPGLTQSVLPAWALIQVALIGITVAWDAGTRLHVPRLRATPHSIRVGRQQITSDDLVAARATGHGVGPLHRAQLHLETRQGTLTVAADGDTVASLTAIAERLTDLRAAPGQRSVRSARS